MTQCYHLYDKMTLDRFFIVVLISLFPIEGITQCIPSTLLPVKDVDVGEGVFIRCSVAFSTPCTDDIFTMEFQKRANEDYDWQPEFQIFSNETGRDIDSIYDYSLSDRVQVHESSGAYDLTIDTTILADGGEWMCVYKGQDGSKFQSEVMSLIVTAPCDVTLVGPPQDDDFYLDYLYTYSCSCSPVSPEINPIWVKSNENYTGTPNNEMENYVWKIRNTIELESSSLEDTNITCIIQKIGDTTWQRSKSISPPPETIGREPTMGNDTTQGDVQSMIGTVLTLVCTACGLNPSITWIHKGQTMEFPNNLFDIDTKQANVNCSYGEVIGLVSTLTWKAPTSRSSALCKDKTKHNGLYQCIVKGQGESSITSQDITVEFHHTNPCISDGGLAGIIVGTILGVGIIVVIVVYCVLNQPENIGSVQ